MGLRAVQDHVADGIALVDEDIEVGQGADDCAGQGGLPHRPGTPHDRDADRGAQGCLRNGIQQTLRAAL